MDMCTQTPAAPSKFSSQSPDWATLPLELRLKVYKYVFNKTVLNVESSGDAAGRTYKRFLTRKLNCKLVFGEYDDELIAPMITWRVRTPSILIAWLNQRPSYQDLIYKLIIHSGKYEEGHQLCLHTFAHSPCFYASSWWFDAQEMSLKLFLPQLVKLSFEVHKSQVVPSRNDKSWPEGVSNAAVYETLVDWKKDIARINPGVKVSLRP